MASITVNKARTIIRKILEKGTELALKPLSVIVLDDGAMPSPLNALMARRRDVLALPTAKLLARLCWEWLAKHRWPAPNNKPILWLQ